jgi:hypothetical protein
MRSAVSTATISFTSAQSADAAAVDTYCGVQGDGNPLPSYFDQGQATSECAQYAAIDTKLAGSTTVAEALSSIESEKAGIDALAATAALVIQRSALTIASNVNTAISEQSVTPLESSSETQAVTAISLYCGINQ